MSAAAVGAEGIGVDLCVANGPLSKKEVAQVVLFVNSLYKEYEGKLFTDDNVRTDEAGVQELACKGALLVARRKCNNPEEEKEGGEEGREIVAVMKMLLDFSPEQGEFGMLAVRREYQRHHIAKQMIVFGEEQCKKAGKLYARVEVLTPAEGAGFILPQKLQLLAWYERMGYRASEKIDFLSMYPEAHKSLLVPVDFTVLLKPISSSSCSVPSSSSFASSSSPSSCSPSTSSSSSFRCCS